MLRRLLALGTTALMTAGCMMDDGYRHGSYSTTPDGACTGSYTGEVFEVSIDPGERIETAPGQGAGVFVEYQSGGRWHVFTACDTDLSGWSCGWDVLASVEAGADLLGIEEDDLEGSDQAYGYDSQSARLLTGTDYDLDGMWVDTNPGAMLRIDALLDCRSAETYMYWISGGGMHRGAPSNPLDLRPTAQAQGVPGP